MKPDLAGLAARLTQARGKNSRAAFGAALGVHPNTIGNYEHGREPPLSYLSAVADQTGVDLGWLITGDGDPMAAPSGTYTKSSLVPEAIQYSVGQAIREYYETRGAAPDLEEAARIMRAVVPYLVGSGITAKNMPKSKQLAAMIGVAAGMIRS